MDSINSEWDSILVNLQHEFCQFSEFHWIEANDETATENKNETPLAHRAAIGLLSQFVSYVYNFYLKFFVEVILVRWIKLITTHKCDKPIWNEKKNVNSTEIQWTDRSRTSNNRFLWIFIFHIFIKHFN